jgi:hypothetical protein
MVEVIKTLQGMQLVNQFDKQGMCWALRLTGKLAKMTCQGQSRSGTTCTTISLSPTLQLTTTARAPTFRFHGIADTRKARVLLDSGASHKLFPRHADSE